MLAISAGSITESYNYDRNLAQSLRYFCKAALHFEADGIPLRRLAAAEVSEEDVCVRHHCSAAYFVT